MPSFGIPFRGKRLPKREKQTSLSLLYFLLERKYQRNIMQSKTRAIVLPLDAKARVRQILGISDIHNELTNSQSVVRLQPRNLSIA